jgi:hypothetical protein
MTRESLETLSARLTREYPNWHFWFSRGASPKLMATRKPPITDDLVDRGLARCLPMGFAESALEEQLIHQAEIERRLSAELADV